MHSYGHSLQELSLCIGQMLQLQKQLVFPAQLMSFMPDVNLPRFTVVLQKGLGIDLHEVNLLLTLLEQRQTTGSDQSIT